MSAPPSRQRIPSAELTVETTPVALDDESVVERCCSSPRSGISPSITSSSSRSAGKIALSCDIEVDGAMPLGQAHSIASGLEAEARKELGPDVEVDTHIEPLEPRELAGEDAPERHATPSPRRCPPRPAAALKIFTTSGPARRRRGSSSTIIAAPIRAPASPRFTKRSMRSNIRCARNFRRSRGSSATPNLCAKADVPLPSPQPAIRGPVLVPVPLRLQRQFRPQSSGDARSCFASAARMPAR